MDDTTAEHPTTSSSSTMFPMLPNEETMQIQIMGLIQQIIQHDGDHPRIMYLQSSCHSSVDVMTGSSVVSFDAASLVPPEVYYGGDMKSANHYQQHAHHNHHQHRHHHSPSRRHHRDSRDTSLLHQQQHTQVLHGSIGADAELSTAISPDTKSTHETLPADSLSSSSSSCLPTNTATGLSSGSDSESTHHSKIINLSHMFTSSVSLDTKIHLHHVELVYSTVLPQPGHGEAYSEMMHFPTITDAIHHARSLFDSTGHADLYIRITSVWKIARYFRYSSHRTTLRLHHVIYDRGGTKKNHNHAWIKLPSPSLPTKRRHM